MGSRLPPHRRRRVVLIALLAAAIASLAFAASALAGDITPETGGSPNADKIDDLYKIALYVAIVVFVGVEGTLLYSVLRFRERKGRVPAQIRGNTRLEIGWTVGAALVLVVLTVVTFAYLPDIKNPARSGTNITGGGVLYASLDQPAPPGGRKLNICVNGQQYVWRFTYSSSCSNTFGKAYAYGTMVVPVDTTVTLDIQAQDVAHSWWIPKLGPKFDAIPGYTNHSWFKISMPGSYPGQCAELCGANHANMLARVRAVPVNEYEAWITRQKQEIDQANQAAAQERKQFSPIPSQ
ncbi:MAG: cytochrome c oxidase subunit [Solirubrobacteraceae bacterium]|nr:cytochrome c oxidase subunit [Solirubrobacteraceae bacterium]